MNAGEYFMLVPRQGDSHVQQQFTRQFEAVLWLQETIMFECFQISIHLDGLEPFVNAVVVQWTNAILNCLVVIVRPVQ